MNKELRYAKGLQVREAASGSKDLVGVPIVYNQETVIRDWYGDYREVIREGACATSLASGKNIRALAHHNTEMPLGTTARGTLVLAEEANQVSCAVTPPDTQAGRDTVESVKRGDIDGMSFGFYVKRDRWTFSNDPNVLDLREILEVDLVEVSFVTFPAYAGTSASVRSEILKDANETDELVELGRLLRRANQGQISGGQTLQARKLVEKISSLLPEALNIEEKQNRQATEAKTENAETIGISLDDVARLEKEFLLAEIEQLELDEITSAG